MAQQARARRYFVRGHVQGVGYRYFVKRYAAELGLRGYTRNLDDGRVEVYAIGSDGPLAELEGRLRTGPVCADVRGVEVLEAAVEDYRTFQIER